MGDVNGRLRRLEDGLPDPGRCAVCRDWSGGRIVYIGVAPVVPADDPPVPERCPACGWAPAEFPIEYVDAGRSA